MLYNIGIHQKFLAKAVHATTDEILAHQVYWCMC